MIHAHIFDDLRRMFTAQTRAEFDLRASQAWALELRRQAEQREGGPIIEGELVRDEPAPLLLDGPRGNPRCPRMIRSCDCGSAYCEGLRGRDASGG